MNKHIQKAPSPTQFFGFRYPPFADTFEVDIPHRTDSEEVCVQRAVSLLSQGRSIAVHGEAGTGKTMFVKSIIGELDTQSYRIAHIPYGGIKPQALLRDLCDEFDIDTTGRKGLIARLNNEFRREPNNSKPFPVIVIDEAHEMLKQSFLDLCSLLHDARTRTAAAALILVGQPKLRKMLELDIYTTVRTRLTWTFAMPRLSDEEAKAFVLYRLQTVQADNGLFDEQALECLVADAKGNRRMIMNLATLCIEEAARRREKLITSELVTDITAQARL